MAKRAKREHVFFSEREKFIQNFGEESEKILIFCALFTKIAQHAGKRCLMPPHRGVFTKSKLSARGGEGAFIPFFLGLSFIILPSLSERGRGGGLKPPVRQRMSSRRPKRISLCITNYLHHDFISQNRLKPPK